MVVSLKEKKEKSVTSSLYLFTAVAYDRDRVGARPHTNGTQQVKRSSPDVSFCPWVARVSSLNKRIFRIR
jgi:hypothetical protein